jgi:hypothetical protein
MLQSLGSRQRIDDSDSTIFYERRVVVKGGSINTVTRCRLCNTEIVHVWIPDSIIILNRHHPTDEWSVGNKPWPLTSTVFESNSRLTRIESDIFSNSSLQSILIPSIA